jgi:hypothetical protein
MMEAIPFFDLLIKIFPFIFKGGKWVINRIKWHGITEGARKIAFAFNSFSWTYLQQPVPEINSLKTIVRPEINQILETWRLTSNNVILYGEAGSGKSGIVLRIAQTMANRGVPVLFIKATDFPVDQDPVQNILNRMPLDKPLIESISQLSKERECSIIIDQLDSIGGTNSCKNLVGFIKALVALPKVKTLIVSRAYELQQDPDISSLNFPKILSDQLTPEQAAFYLSQIGIISPTQALVELACNLLNLSLIAEVVKTTNNHNIEITSDIKLWKQYYYSIVSHEDEEIADYVLKLAREVTAKGEQSFSTNFPSLYYRRKLLSRNILIESPGRRFSFRHEQLQNFLCAFSILPEKLSFSQVANEFRPNSSKGVIRWLHKLYHDEFPDIESVFINDILAAKGDLPFYSRITILENLREQTNPVEAAAKIISKHLSHQAYQRFFFEDLDTPAWVEPLHKTGFFLSPPEPIETQPGYYQIPDWPAGKYLARFAGQYENIIVDVVKATLTENWRVQEIFVDALLKISPVKSVECLSNIDNWLNCRFSDMLPNKLSSFADYLFDNGLIHSATQLLEIVITPVLSSTKMDYIKYRSGVQFRSDHYWVEEFCGKLLPKLLEKNPGNVVLTFEKLVEETIEIVKHVDSEKAELQVGYYWRLDIPNRTLSHGEGDTIDLLIEGLRDSLTEVCRKNIAEGEKFLINYLNSEHIILKRLALFILRAFGENFPELINQALSTRAYLENSEYYYEYRGILRDQFNIASEEVKSLVISWILSGPKNVELKAERRAKLQNREVTENDRQYAKEEWTLYHLEIIKEFLASENLAHLNALTEIYGKPDISERPRFVITSLGEAPSPVSAEDLYQKSFEEIKQIFLTYVSDDLLPDSRESLAQAFQRLVSEDFEKYSFFATYLADLSIPLIYIYHFLLGIHGGIRSKGCKLTNEILYLCEFVITQKNNTFLEISADYESGLLTIQKEAAYLLEEALRIGKPYLSREQLDRIRTLLICLVHHPDPDPSTENNTGHDAFTNSMNCMRGEAIHGIFQYSLYLIRQREIPPDMIGKEDYLEPEIKYVLEEKVDFEVESSLAVHSVFGAFVPQLHYLSREWLVLNLDKIFPKDEDMESVWRAAWEAYVITAKVYVDVFNLLASQYLRGVRFLGKPQEEKNYPGGSCGEQLAQHIMDAYLLGLTDFGHENQLLDQFFTNAPDKIRSQGILWLSQVLGINQSSADNILWKKCRRLWEKRLEFAGNQDVEHNSQEISSYIRWLINCPEEFDLVFPLALKSVKYLHGRYESQQLVNYVSKHCEQNPLNAIILLKMAILSAKEPWWVLSDKDEEKILRSAITSKDEEAKKIAVDIINIRGEQGDFRMKHLLD